MKLENTGERMIPEFHKNTEIYGEHVVRYQSVTSMVKGKTVLDIASGSGYGTQLIASSAAEVIGVDISKESIEYARKNFPAKNLTYKEGSGTEIPVESKTVDVVTSFETIEHIDNYKGFLKEVKRVLKPGGQFIVSTPNDAEFPEGAHYHIHEFQLDELESLLKKHFKNVKFYYQATWLYTGVFDEQQFTSEWDTNFPTIKALEHPTTKSVYVTVVCSDATLGKIEPVGAISELWSQKQQNIDEYHMMENEKQLTELKNILAMSKNEVDVALSELAAIKGSRSWKIILLLRKIKKTLG